MHGFDSRQEDASTAKGFEAQHRPDDALDGSMSLFDNIVQVLGLMQLEECAGVGNHALDGSGVSATFIDADLIGQAVQANGS